MKKSLTSIELLPDRLKILGCLLLNILLGVIDYITRDFTLTMFYLIPIALASWFIGENAGRIISMICGVELFIIDLLVAPKYVSITSIRSWNALMEVCYLLLVGYLITKVKSEMDHTRQRTKDLEIANQDLEAYNYIVAHDLRQPLNIINIYCQEILELYGSQLEKECRHYVEGIYDGSLRMNKLVGDLLNFARLAHTEPHRTRVDLSALAREVSSELGQAEPDRHVIFLIDEGIEASGDEALLRVVLGNLIGNAWKYSGMRDKAIIKFGVTVFDGKPAYYVSDNGAGFDMGDAEKLFIPFQRLHGTEAYKGFGIGLATVERIVRSHGGKIWAEGEVGKGAIFYFTLGSGKTSDKLRST